MQRTVPCSARRGECDPGSVDDMRAFRDAGLAAGPDFPAIYAVRALAVYIGEQIDVRMREDLFQLHHDCAGDSPD